MPTPRKTLSSADDLVPLVALCCCITSCYNDWPEVLGCRVKQVLGCWAFECISMKPACECCGEINPQLKENPRNLFLCCQGSSLLINPNTCISVNAQCLCCDCRGALPCTGPDGDVPCVFSLACCTICYSWSCRPAACSSLGALREASIQDMVKEGGAPHTSISDDCSHYPPTNSFIDRRCS